MITVIAVSAFASPSQEVDIDFDFAPAEVQSLPADGANDVPVDAVPAFLISSPDGVEQYTPLFYEVRLIESPSGTVVHEAVIDGEDAFGSASDVFIELAGVPELTAGSFYTAVVETEDVTVAEAAFGVVDARAEPLDAAGLVLESAGREPGRGTSWLYRLDWSADSTDGMLRLSDAGGNIVALHAASDERAITWTSPDPVDELCLFAEVCNAAGVFSEPRELPCLTVEVWPSRFDHPDRRPSCSTAPSVLGVGTLALLGLLGTRRRQ